MDTRSDLMVLSNMDNVSRKHFHFLQNKYVSRTLKCCPDKFQEVCHMHLAFILDLKDDKLELLLSSEEERKTTLGTVAAALFRRKTDKIPVCVGAFGLPLTDEGVVLMSPLVKFLKQEKNICKEGLFRKPGNRCRMNTLRDLLIQHGPAIQIDAEIYSVHDIAGVLKEFLRELPEQLLTERHMEAHQQILALGSHSTTEEAIARYKKKKLTALQLLMLLMPPPAQKMTQQVIMLLQRVADCPETKMTPATLGTIFAPIFFLSRKVDPTEVCGLVTLMEPALAFMIENAHELFQAPKELVIDLIKYWNTFEGNSADSERSSDSPLIKKSISGQTLNTNVCYIDRRLSKCDDVAQNTQSELESLYAHVLSLPDTPHNLKLKKQFLKGTTTPTSSAKKHSRSKSIGASIKKRFPSLGKSKNRHCEPSSQSCSSTSSDNCREIDLTRFKYTDKVAVVHCLHIERNSSQSLRKRLDFYDLQHISKTPVMKDLLTSPVNSMNAPGASRMSRPRHKRRCTNENASTSECTPPKQECKISENATLSGKASIENIYSSNDENQNKCCKNVDPSNENVDPHKLSLKPSDLNSKLPSTSVTVTPKRTASPLTPKNQTVMTENEINYLPHQLAPKVSVPHTPKREIKPVVKVHPRPCKGPGTPIMPRTLLQLAQNNSLETSI